MQKDKLSVLRSARLKIDAMMAAVMLLYGAVAYVTYPGNLLLWINIAILSAIMLSVYLVVRRWIGKMIRSITSDFAVTNLFAHIGFLAVRL
jgi:hypothetical protein